MNKLIIKSISKKYNDKEVLKNISFSVKENEIVSILGPSGCGKTTLFNIIAGLISPDSGTVLIDNKGVTNITGNVSYMPQNDLLLPYKTIMENVSLPLLLSGKSKKYAQDTVKKYFNIFLISGTENKYPHELSGGMRQRASFLRTYMYSKDIMLLDEPFSALDSITKNTMYNWYLSIAKKLKKTTLFITHNIDEAIFLSDSVYVFSCKSLNITKCIKIFQNKTSDFLFSHEFIKYKKEIIDLLKFS